jgi:uncharacterized OB-fold protein
VVSDAAFPIPVPDADTQPFWDACARGELLIQRCGACGRWLWQPRPICSSCQKPDPVWTRVSGDGVVASWMVMRPPTLPAYADVVPFVILLVELAEGVRLIGYLVDDAGRMLKTDGAAEKVAIGARVALRFHDQAGTPLPCWTMAARRV